MPFTDAREAALGELADAISRLREAGLAAEGVLGDSDPLIAVNDVWDPLRYDEIIISTLPTGPSKWLHAAFPERVARLTGAPVRHLVCQPSKTPVETVAATVSAHETMGPLSVLGWGGPKVLGWGGSRELAPSDPQRRPQRAQVAGRGWRRRRRALMHRLSKRAR